MPHTLAQQFAERLLEFRSSNDDETALHAAHSAVIDTIAVTLLGAVADSATIARQSLLDATENGPCTLYGTSFKASALDAAMFNGIASHADDFDDFTDVFGGHPSVPVLPATLALAEQHSNSGLDVMRAYLAGVEMENRIANGVHFHHYEKGWHPTSTLGVFGATAACAHLLDLDLHQTSTALAIAASFASGIKANFGSMTKPLHVGHCARSGLQAAKLAEGGFTARSDAFEHKQGFFEVYNGAGNYNTDIMLSDWFSPAIAVKPGASIKQFPCCGSTHPAIYMALRLADKHTIDLAQVEKITVAATPKRLPHTNYPDPQSDLQAKFSIQYAVARAFTTGPLRLEHFVNKAYDKQSVRAWMTKITIQPDESLGQSISDNAFGSEVTVHLNDGQTLSERTEHLPGRGREYPMTHNELRDKFMDCASRVLPEAQATKVFTSLEQLRSLNNIDSITAATRI